MTTANPLNISFTPADAAELYQVPNWSGGWFRVSDKGQIEVTPSPGLHAPLRATDPIMTTAWTARNHGYMIYDTLIATDSNFKIQPQMADWTISDDKLTYTFTLRDGLKWHDGAPVTAEDCIASLKRWTAVDGMAQKLAQFTASLEAGGPTLLGLPVATWVAGVGGLWALLAAWPRR
mgnify:CR=1 FL=1